MGVKVFLSYATADRALAEKVEQGLRQDGVEIRSDHLSTAGDDWAEQLKAGLEGSDAVVLILSDASVSSSFVMMELGAAKALKKRVVAIKPTKTDVPNALAGLALKTLDIAEMSARELSHTIQAELAA